MPRGTHPVGGQFDIRQVRHRRRQQIGNSFCDGDPCRRGAVQQRHGRAFSHAHGFTQIAVQRNRRNCTICYRNLPGAYHLVPGHQAGNRPIANGNKEALASHGGKLQHPLQGLSNRNVSGKIIDTGGTPVGLPVHFRRLTEQQTHG